jgi:hypothetical protein
MDKVLINKILIIGIILLFFFFGIYLLTSSGLYDDKPASYTVTLMEKALYEDWTTAKAVNATTPSGNITSDDYGTKTINGIKVYYMTYTERYMVDYDDDFHYKVTGTLFFKKDGEWQHITWTDAKGNPNKATIEKEISDKINSI